MTRDDWKIVRWLVFEFMILFVLALLTGPYSPFGLAAALAGAIYFTIVFSLAGVTDFRSWVHASWMTIVVIGGLWGFILVNLVVDVLQYVFGGK